MKSIFLIACSKSKALKKLPAGELYLSDRFKLARAFADDYTDEWFIVSAEHGLLNPKDVIDPYDNSLHDMNQIERDAWAMNVCQQLSSHINKQTQVVCLGDPNYFEGISRWLIEKQVTVYNPFRYLPEEKRLEWLKGARKSSSRSQHLRELHALLDKCGHRAGQLRAFHECSGSMQWPRRGLYVFYGSSEKRMLAPNNSRVVRIGTHGVSAGSKSTLWQRLKTHKGKVDGGGNHRSSIFRSHVGAAIIAKNEINSPSWGVGQTAKRSIRDSEAEIERQVSAYINSLLLLWLDIEDESSKHSDRAYLEQNMIALLSGSVGPLDIANETWLGFHCPNPAVRRSCLWNVNYTNFYYDPDFLDVLSAYVDVAVGRRSTPKHPLAPDFWLENAKSGYRQQNLALR